jgi:hypothetical protein
MGPLEIHPGYDSFPSPFRKKLKNGMTGSHLNPFLLGNNLSQNSMKNSFHQVELQRLGTKSSVSKQGKPNPFINL